MNHKAYITNDSAPQPKVDLIAEPASTDPWNLSGRSQAGFGTESRQQTAIDSGRYWRAFQKRWVMALVFALPLAALTTGAVWRYLPKTYTTTAVLRLASSEKTLIFNTADSNQPSGNVFDMYKRTQRQLLCSRFVITHALRDDTLARIPAIQTESDPVQWLEKSLAIAFPDDAEIMTVSLTAKNPDRLHLLVNAVVKSYFEEVVYEERKNKLERLNDLELAHKKFEAELRVKRTELKQLMDRVGASDSTTLSLEQKNSLDQYTMIRQQYQKVQLELMEAEIEQHSTRSDGNDDPSQPAGAELLQALRNDPEMEQLKTDRQQIVNLIQSTKELFKSDAAKPRLEELDQRLKQHDRKIEVRRQQVGAELTDFLRQAKSFSSEANKRQQKLLKAKEQRLKTELRNLEASVHTPKSSTDVEMMRIDINGLQDVVSRLGAEIERTKVELQPETKGSSNRVTELTAAQPARSADAKSRMTKAAGAGLAAFLLPILLLVWIEARKDNVHSGQELVHDLGLSVIGNMPLIPQRVMRRLGHQSEKHRYWRTRLSESVDAITAVLLRRAQVSDDHVVMVSSATAGEGKTTLASNLAWSLASAGNRTVLVDFDLRRPAIHRVLGLELQPGIYDVLRDPQMLDSSLQQTQVPNLTFLAAGWCDSKGISGLTTSSMKVLFDNLRSRFDFVVVDGSPILPVVDTRLIAQHVDAVVLSVLSDVSRVWQVRRACQLLESFAIPICGVVVTGSRNEAYSDTYYESLTLNEAL